MNISYLKRNIYKILKRNKWVFYIYEWLKWHKEIEYQKEINDRNNLKTKERIKYEESLVCRYWRIGTFHYYRYGLQYKHLSDEEILDYVPTYYFHKNIEHHHAGIDTVKYGDKLMQAMLFEERHIPTAKVVAIFKNNKWCDINDGSNVDFESIVDQLLAVPNNKLFVKPTGNCGGYGIWVLKKQDDRLILNGKIIESLREFYSKLDKTLIYIVEENIIQNSQLSAINSSSVNTLRVVVQRREDKMEIITTILRMGRAGKEVDNSAQGGISINVDTVTGRFGDCATAEHGGGYILSHPDSNYIFKGKGINNWEAVKSEIVLIANKLIDFKDIALDIALTEQGARLLEFNFRYGIEHQQCVIGGVRRIFNIPNK